MDPIDWLRDHPVRVLGVLASLALAGFALVGLLGDGQRPAEPQAVVSAGSDGSLEDEHERRHDENNAKLAAFLSDSASLAAQEAERAFAELCVPGYRLFGHEREALEDAAEQLLAEAEAHPTEHLSQLVAASLASLAGCSRKDDRVIRPTLDQAAEVLLAYLDELEGPNRFLDRID